MDWTNGYDPTISREEEPLYHWIEEKPYLIEGLIKGVWGELYSREQVDKMTICEQLQKLGKIS